MKTVKVKAIFKGQDGSCGYNTNVEYTLVITHKKESRICIVDVSGSRKCEYDSIISFLANWDNLRKA